MIYSQYVGLLAEQISRWLESIALQYGYFGVFIISFLGSASIIFPIPYTLIIFYLGSLGIFNPTLLALSGGAGSALGEFLGYALGYCGRAALSEERKKKINYILEILDRYGALAIFLFALTPLPDDLLFIPLGLMRYSLKKAIIPCLAGKILMCLILAYGGQFSMGMIRNIFGGEEGGALGMIISAILLVILLILMLKIDWEKILLKERRCS